MITKQKISSEAQWKSLVYDYLNELNEIIPKDKYYVYTLINPIDNSIFYAGKGINKRVLSHFKLNRNGNVFINDKIKLIYSYGLKPLYNIVYSDFNEKNVFKKESEIIKQLILDGFDLSNIIHNQNRRSINYKCILIDESIRLYNLFKSNIVPREYEKVISKSEIMAICKNLAIGIIGNDETLKQRYGTFCTN